MLLTQSHHVCYNTDMKIIRIDDKVHEQLKKEASEKGVFLHWLIEQKLTTEKKKVVARYHYEPIVVPDNQGWKAV
jgi:hypothetical protein